MCWLVAKFDSRWYRSESAVNEHVWGDVDVCDGWKDQIDISSGSRSLFVGPIFSENFRDLRTAQYIYPTPLRRHTFPLLSIWNLVFELSSGTLSQNTSRWDSRITNHATWLITITPWSYNGRILWNVLRKEGRDPRLTSRTSCSSFWWPRSLSPSRWLGTVFKCV